MEFSLVEEKNFTHQSLRVMSLSTTVPGGGLVRFVPSFLKNSLALILFFTITTENLGLESESQNLKKI